MIIKKIKFRIILISVMSLILGTMLTACLAGNTKTENKPEDNSTADKTEVTAKPGASPRFVTLMFHAISDQDIKGVNTVTKKSFEKVLEYLTENHYKFLSAQEVYEFLTEKTSIPEKSIWITFDDGLESAYKDATPILKKYNAKATAFVEVKQIGDTGRLTKNDLKAMANSGIWDIQSHGYNGHSTPLTDSKGKKVNFYFNRLLIGDILETEDDFKTRIKKDIKKSFDILEKEYGSKRYFFAYPLDGATYETSELIDEIRAGLDEINIIGIGVSGSKKIAIDWSNPKHCYTRVGFKNSSDIREILSLANN